MALIKQRCQGKEDQYDHIARVPFPFPCSSHSHSHTSLSTHTPSVSLAPLSRPPTWLSSLACRRRTRRRRSRHRPPVSNRRLHCLALPRRGILYDAAGESGGATMQKEIGEASKERQMVWYCELRGRQGVEDIDCNG